MVSTTIGRIAALLIDVSSPHADIRMRTCVAILVLQLHLYW